MEYLIVAALALTLVFLVRGSFPSETARPVLGVLLAAFAARLFIHVFIVRSGSLDYGGDNFYYELSAMEIVTYWQSAGIQLVSSEVIPSINTVATPCHIFAFVMYLCGGFAPMACTAVVAFIACGLCIVMYKFAQLVGADDRSAFRLLLLIAFIPGLLVHTSDMFKDGFNAFFVITCLWLATSNMKRFDIRKILAMAPLIWALWNVRPYMVIMCGLPLFFSIVSRKRMISVRVMALSVAAMMSFMLLYEQILATGPAGTMQRQLEKSQATNVRSELEQGGSGVVFTPDGAPWDDLPTKVIYTLLSPFPWMDGSPALQLGKIEALLVWYLLYCAVKGGRRLWQYDRKMLLFLLLFVVPSTIAYATTIANIGLIFRQRIPIVLILSLLSAIGWAREPGMIKRSQPVDKRSHDEPSPANGTAGSG
ncbi:hypothetical protein [Nonomuraea basaltis]|uniref:hypothetical protein n=1 Tax=Nonomuraea basaltis TaxID=2495887 RepID=UPI00110C706F|nr:hypothetical protein [Nonomuraea basaltis]TMR97245.1 hypothetical protein EJK15_18990 [Nonomuraea basaltis]